jgi:hypothetical protein
MFPSNLHVRTYLIYIQITYSHPCSTKEPVVSPVMQIDDHHRRLTDDSETPVLELAETRHGRATKHLRLHQEPYSKTYTYSSPTAVTRGNETGHPSSLSSKRVREGRRIREQWRSLAAMFRTTYQGNRGRRRDATCRTMDRGLRGWRHRRETRRMAACSLQDGGSRTPRMAVRRGERAL